MFLTNVKRTRFAFGSRAGRAPFGARPEEPSVPLNLNGRRTAAVLLASVASQSCARSQSRASREAAAGGRVLQSENSRASSTHSPSGASR